MTSFFDEIRILLRDFDPIRDGFDIVLVAVLNYKILMLIRGTRAWRIVFGALVFVMLLLMSHASKLTTLHWILEKAALLAPVALVVLLLPELRQALEGIVRWPGRILGSEEPTEARTIEEIVAAAAELAAARIGALIVVQRHEPLATIEANGVVLNARVSAALLVSIFYEGNPLHDGAAVIRGDTVVAAACRLPLSESQWADRSAHMRHRAALGASEAFDCLVVVVSEEKGTISVAENGQLHKLGGPSEVRDLLYRDLRNGEEQRTRNKLSFKSKAEVK